MEIRETANLIEAKKYYLETKEDVRVSRKIEDKNFLNNFVLHFKNLTTLNFDAYGDGVSYDFLYKLNSLNSLHLHCMYEVDFSQLDNLLSLSIWWNKKMIKNIEALTKLEHLTLIEFDEKDLGKLSALTSLKTLSLKTAKIKSLKGIEKLTNLKCLSLGGVRGLTDISDITSLQNLKFLEFDICWKMQDFSPLANLKELEVLQLMDCKNLTSINFVEQMPKLKQLYTLGTTIINDYDTTPAENIPVFFGSQYNKYNKQYPEKEIKEGQKGWNSYL